MEGHLNTLTGEVSVEPQVGLRRGFLTKIAVLIAVTLGSMVLAGWLWGIRPLTA